MVRAAGPEVRRICVFAQLWRTGLGDLIMRNGLFALLRRGFPGATVSLIIGAEDASDFAEFLTLHCPVDEIIVCPPCGAGGTGSSSDWEAVLAEVAHRGFDLCLVDAGTVDLHASFARQAGIPVRVGVRHGHPQEAELTSTAPLLARAGGDPDLADYLDAYAAALGLAPLDHPARAVAPMHFVPEGGPPPAGGRPRVALHVGGGRYWNRRWPLDRYVRLCDRLLTERGGSVVLVGVQEDEEHSALLAGVRPEVRDRIAVLGDVSIARTATVVSDSDLFVGSDSGPMHLAVAVGATTVTLYGPADGVLFWEHVYPRHHPIGRRWPCHRIPHDWVARDEAPCEHRCRYPVLSDASDYPACVSDIAVDEVLEVMYGLLDAG